MEIRAFKLFWGALALWVITVPMAYGYASPAMIDKNLFSADRKPLAPDQPTTAPQTNKSSLSAKAVQLDGIFQYGEVKKALVRLKGQMPDGGKRGASPYRTCGEGEMLGDFRVARIETKSIVLEKEGQFYEVSIFAEGKVVPPVAAPPPPPLMPGQEGQPSGGGAPAQGAGPHPGAPVQPPGLPAAQGGAPVMPVQPAEPQGANMVAAPPAEEHMVPAPDQGNEEVGVEEEVPEEGDAPAE